CLVVGVPTGILMEASPRHAPPRSIKRDQHPAAEQPGERRGPEDDGDGVRSCRRKF
ncbi:unnamed protein product, partial [Ascophyllum nodosum]